MTRDPEALASALQLLLGDVPDEEKRALFYKAFPDSFVLVKGDSARIRGQTQSIASMLANAFDKCDGSSPLGVIAVGQLRDLLRAAQIDLKAVRQALGL